ncbi:acyltransferase [Devosia sp.]|uniref:acyltransferase family protein n=1 Tax=Devosia sp. TaxID=1871048 RepID=UPI0032675FB7
MNQHLIDPSLHTANPVNPPLRLDELTAARGFAACFVVLYHVDAYAQGFLSRWFPPLHYGPLAVDFFFVLSGFVLTHVYRDAWRNGSYRHASFMLKRFARVWPLHIATLLGVAALILVGTRLGLVPDWQPSVTSFLLNVTMLHATGLASELAWNQPSWSISAEWCAYLAFPLFLLAVDRLPSLLARLIAAALLFVICALVASQVLHEDLMEMTIHIGVLRIIPSFFAGVVLRYWLDQTSTPDARDTGLLSMLLLATLAAALNAAWLGAANAVFWPIIIVTILLLAHRGKSAKAGLMRAKPLLWLGDISYALYLVHAPVLMLAFGVGGKLLHLTTPAALAMLGLIAFAVAIAIAHLAHVLIERPAQRLIVGLAKPKQQTAAA